MILVEHFFDAVNRNDLADATRDFDADVVRVEPEGFPTSGTYRGIDAVRAQLARGRGTWAEGSCNVEKILVKADKVVAYLHAWVRLNGATEWTGGRFADGFVIRHGRIIEHRSFAERKDALEWAGIDDAAVTGKEAA